MEFVKAGDRVRILCSSLDGDGSPIETETVRNKPYWIRSGATTKHKSVSQALVGMQVGERKTLVIEPKDAFGADASHRLAAQTLTYVLEVVAIKS